MTISTTFLILKLYLSYTQAVLKVSSSCVLCLLPLFPHSLPSATINIKDSARRFTCLHSLWQRIHLPSGVGIRASPSFLVLDCTIIQRL
ncbi:hypothetical protein B0H19DRAFT_1194815 [Mycena capillaripes]|nr:hypothetical protein B0H19DRAFT_1194815 [Mycena capillaripes]